MNRRTWFKHLFQGAAAITAVPLAQRLAELNQTVDENLTITQPGLLLEPQEAVPTLDQTITQPELLLEPPTVSYFTTNAQGIYMSTVWTYNISTKW